MPRPLHWITDKGIASKNQWKVLKRRATDKYLHLEKTTETIFFFFNLVWWYEIDDNDNDDDEDEVEDSNGYPATGAQGQGFILCQKELTLLKLARHAHSTHPY